jgi:serine/threonine-protein kinase
MSLSVADFWRLAERAQLLTSQQCQQWNMEYRSLHQPPESNDVIKMAAWLVSRNVFSEYQTTVLLAGHAGPFAYGDYKVYDRIASGRLANWFRAVHGATGHPVMLHFLAGPIVQDARLWATAATEVQRATSLIHPHLWRYHEIVDLGQWKHVVTENLVGITLEERLSQGRLAPMEACRLARGLALGIAALHASGRPHGDIRPHHVWLEQSSPQQGDTVKLLRDAWLLPQPPNFVADDPHGQLAARCDYIAPEFQMPGKGFDALTDIYSLGCTFYHMLAGQPPFPGGNVAQKLTRHANEAIQPLENFGIPAPLAQMVMYLMAKNPAVRYQDAQTVADQLAAFLDPQWLALPTASVYPTLPVYEQALHQTQLALAAQQQAAAQSVSDANAAATNAVPPGKVVDAKGTAPPPVIAAPQKPGVKVPVNVKEFAQEREKREMSKMITMLASIGGVLIVLILLVNYYGGSQGTITATTKSDPNTSGTTPVPDTPELEELRGVVTVDTQPPSPPADKTTSPPADKSPVAKESPSTTRVVETVPDDGQLLWASPTSGTPVELKYVPPLAGFYVVVRAAELLATPEGERMVQSLGPVANGAIARWEQAAGIRLADVDTLIFSLHDNESKFPGVSVVARLSAPRETAAWQTQWGPTTEKKDGQQTYYVGSNGWAYYLPPSENGQVVVTASEYLFQDALDSPYALLKQELSQLRLSTDNTRHVNVLFNPSFLFGGGGDPLFAAELKRVREPLQWLLGEGLQAGSVSLHLEEQFYLEMRFVTKVDKDPMKLAGEFRERLAAVPNHLTTYFAEQLNPPVYWKKFAFRFPGMIEKLHEMMRVGVEDKQAVVNATLPGPAAHNLVLGTELTLATAPGAAQVAATGPGASGAYNGPATLEEAMEKIVVKDFSFAQHSLERAVELLQDELKAGTAGASFEARIRILGTDLQLEGITRNQSVRDFMQQNKSAADILTAMVMKANPVTTVKEPTETDQKLVWLVGKDPDDGKPSVLVTTRSSAEKRKDKLPAVFVPK